MKITTKVLQGQAHEKEAFARFRATREALTFFRATRAVSGLGPLVTEQVFIDDHTTHYTLPMGYTDKAGKLVHHK